MLKFNDSIRFGRLLVAVSVMVAFAGPAVAGNVYSWVTEDGVHAFTDDSKRIPEKHRGEARQRYVGNVATYERYTPIQRREAKAYGERVMARREALRSAKAPAAEGSVVGGAVAGAGGVSLDYTAAVTGGTTRSGRNGVSARIPLAGGVDDDEPTVIESRRMEPTDSLATRHWTFVRKGDRIISIIKGERRQRPLKAISEKTYEDTEYDY